MMQSIFDWRRPKWRFWAQFDISDSSVDTTGQSGCLFNRVL